jgi:pimeloyl-ACP methyl ester carboxylesterase
MSKFASKFARESHTINGVETVVHTAGGGEPLVFFHGGGTVEGFHFAESWADRFRVIIPYHPGFGESGDDPTLTDAHDYVMHYLELFDALRLDRFNLVGLSFGGNLAARFASEHGHRVKKLGLIAPYGLIDPANPLLDILAVPGEQIPGLLVSNIDVLLKRLPEKPDLDFMAAGYREATTLARLFWERPGDPKFMRYLHRIKMPTMIVLGDEDKIVPVGQAQTWRKFIPNADIRIFKGAGHLVHLERREAVDAVASFLA